MEDYESKIMEEKVEVVAEIAEVVEEHHTEPEEALPIQDSQEIIMTHSQLLNEQR